jgi:hypothetical protein
MINQLIDNDIKFLNNIFDEFKENKTLPRSDLFDMLPEYMKTDAKKRCWYKRIYADIKEYATKEKLAYADVLNTIYTESKNNAKSDKINIDFNFIVDEIVSYLRTNSDSNSLLPPINDIIENITESSFVDFLRFQTQGKDWKNYIYLIKYFNLKKDDNRMIIFTEEFPFDNRIKKEALFIWHIFECIQNNETLGKHINTSVMMYDLQTKFDLDFLPSQKNKRFDIVFPKLAMAFEIDECHPQGNTNDILKTAKLQLHGVHVLRINFQEIHIGTIINNINSKIYNNSYLSSFITKMEFALTCALLKASVLGRQDYIIHLFKIHLNDKIKLLESRMTNLINTSEEYALVDNTLKKTKDCLFNMSSEDSKDFKNMFDLKNECNKNPSAKIISYDKIIMLLNDELYDNLFDKTKFIQFLYKNLMIDSIKIDINDIKFNWRDVSFIILSFLDDSLIKDVLVEYYNEIEESYEIIIKNISFHTEKITGNRKIYNLCMNNVKEIITLDISNKKNKVITNLEKRVDTLEDKVDSMQNELDQFDYENTNMCTELNNLKIDNEALRNQIRLLNIAAANKIVYNKPTMIIAETQTNLNDNNYPMNSLEIHTELKLSLNKQVLPPSPTTPTTTEIKSETVVSSECDGSDFDCLSEYECKSDY